MTEILTYTVPAMHCAHCERAIHTEIAKVAGVETVDVDLDTKLVTIRGSEVSDAAVREAIDEAGYEALP
jgi:copper chaperone CopZ